MVAKASAQPPPKTGRREQAKEERRSRIVTAARDLMTHVGVEEMSMKQVAARADVSLSTVYNLFESKDDVLTRVFTESFERYRVLIVRKRSKDALKNIFDAVDISADIYNSDADFYRSSVWLVGKDSSLKLRLQEPRVRFFCELVEEALQAGQLRAGTDSAIVGACCVVPMFSSSYQAWAAGTATIEEFAVRAKFGIACVLKAFVTPAEAARLEEMVATLGEALRKFASGRERSAQSR